jgi:hypothetical protein
MKLHVKTKHRTWKCAVKTQKVHVVLVYIVCYFLYDYYCFIRKSAEIDSTRKTNKAQQFLQTGRNLWTSLIPLHSLSLQHSSLNVVRETAGALLVTSVLCWIFTSQLC